MSKNILKEYESINFVKCDALPWLRVATQWLSQYAHHFVMIASLHILLVQLELAVCLFET